MRRGLFASQRPAVRIGSITVRPLPTPTYEEGANRVDRRSHLELDEFCRKRPQPPSLTICPAELPWARFGKPIPFLGCPLGEIGRRLRAVIHSHAPLLDGEASRPVATGPPILLLHPTDQDRSSRDVRRDAYRAASDTCARSR